MGERTPFMVHCEIHGEVFLSEAEYMHQMRRPDFLWACPTCGRNAMWDDNNYESRIEEWEKKQS